LTLGYIDREIPFSDNIKNPKKSLYKIVDPFIRFYFNFVVPNRSYIEMGRVEPIINQVQQQFPAYVSFMWERFCRQSVPSIKFNGVSFKPASKWWGTLSKNSIMKLDIVAESVDGNYLLVADCKWTDKVYGTKNLFKELEEKAVLLPFLNNRTVIPALFLKETEKRDRENNVFTPNDLLYT
jgi:AAA+ ATPase superfamily predicted ATPase